MRELARRLLALEAASESGSGAAGIADGQGHEAVRVYEKLRVSLTRFAGAEGFASLLRRALALARAEIPALHAVDIKPDCSMEGLAEFAAATDAAAALTSHLLFLLVTFVGEPLTLRLVRETWPDAALEDQS